MECGTGIRERYGRQAVLVGFTTYQGTVTAASDWNQPAERKRVRPGLPGSVERLLHEVGTGGDVLLPIRGPSGVRRALSARRLERAIGVIYRPNGPATIWRLRWRASSMP